VRYVGCPHNGNIMPVKNSFKNTDYFSLLGLFSLSIYHLKEEADSVPKTLWVFSLGHAMQSGLYKLMQFRPTRL